MVGRLVANRYLIEEPCERTAASAIYRARHLLADRTVLLRVLVARDEVRHEQCRDALAVAERAAALPTPHVARTLDVGVVAERWPFIVTEFTKGQTLDGVLSSEGPLGLRRALPIARALAGVLAMAHTNGVMHGPLLPSGIWVESPSGRAEWVRMLDFGVPELPEPTCESARSGVFRSFARPGQGPNFGLDSIRADLQALGTLLYELTLGSSGGVARDVAGLLDARFSGSAWGGERPLARGFAMILERCLFPLPEGVYRSMAEVSRDLDTLAETATALQLATPERRVPITTVHAPARRTCIAVGGPKVIVRG